MTWDVRFPDGQMLRGLTTTAVREQIRTGRIPSGSLARPTGTGVDWTTLEWLPEFAGVVTERNRTDTPVPGASSAALSVPKRSVRTSDAELVSVADRLETAQLGLLGAIAVLREILTALDVVLMPAKLRLVLLLGVLASVMFVVPSLVWVLPGWVVATQALVALALLAVGSSLLSQGVYVELSRNRPARWREMRKRVVATSLRLFLGYLLVPGVGLSALAGLCQLSSYLLTGETTLAVVGGFAVAVVAVALALVLIVLGPTLLMLAPILVVEECSLLRGLAQWRELLGENLGRVLLYDLLATGLLVLFLAVPAALVPAIGLVPLDPRCVPLLLAIQGGLAGLLVALALGYLVVVQMFLYLNLRFVA